MPSPPELDIGQVTHALERAWANLRAVQPVLPVAQMIFGRGTGPRIRLEDFPPQIFISDELLNHGAIVVLEALVHEAAHLLAEQEKFPDTSSGGKYHNRGFAVRVRRLDAFTEPPSAKFGSAVVHLTPEFSEIHSGLIGNIRALLPSQRGRPAAPDFVCRPRRVQRSGRHSPTARCQCKPPRKFEMSHAALSIGNIRCEVCGSAFRYQSSAS